MLLARTQIAFSGIGKVRTGGDSAPTRSCQDLRPCHLKAPKDFIYFVPCCSYLWLAWNQSADDSLI